MEVYADLLFVIDFAMNFLALWVSRKICGVYAPLWRITLSAAVSAILCCFAVFLGAASGLVLGVFLTSVGVFCAFPSKKPKLLLKLTLTAIVAAFCAGGAMSAVFYEGFTFSPKVFVIGSAAAYSALTGFKLIIRKKEMEKQTFCTLKITSDGAAQEIPALVDTGNTLCDPISQTPVVVAELNSVKPLLPPEIRAVFDNRQSGDLAALTKAGENSSFYGRIRLIPFKSVGADTQMLIGFRPDTTELFFEKRKITVKAVIGIYEGSLDGEYAALINPALLR